MKFWAYFLIPVYTVLFTRGYNWFTTNFSGIGNFFDRKKSLLWIIGARYRISPGAYRRFLYGWGAIVGVSVFLLAAAGIISSALEIYVTLTSVAMAERLVCRIAAQKEMPDGGEKVSEEDSQGNCGGKHRKQLLT